MNCKVCGFKQTNYHNNPLVTPLLNFHGMVISLGSELASGGKTAEIVKRIAVAVVSPFVYLALAFVALTGLILNAIWEKRRVSQGVVNSQGNQELACIKSDLAETEVLGTKKTESEMAVQLPPGAFGKEEWEKAFPVTIGEVPPLPSNIDEILEIDDPCEPGKKLKETCLLFLRPKKVMLHEEGEGKEITLGFDGLAELATIATNPDRRTKFYTFDELDSQLNQMPVAEGGWVLMRKELIPGSRGIDFESQQGMLKGGFEVPKLMDAVLLNILTFAAKGKCLFGQKPWTYTRCQEMCKSYQTIVGGFDSSGLCIGISQFEDGSHGLSGSWKF